jgi:glycosyltransferase involved in cell wall biosynthesis
VKVLHINDYSTSGGAEVQMAVTVRMLRDAGIEAESFTIDDVPANCRRLTPRRYIDNPQARLALRRRLDELKPDVVHLHNFYHVVSPGILAELRRYRGRVVMTAHDYHLICPSAGACWYRRRGSKPQLADFSKLGSMRYLFSRRWDHRGAAHSLLKLAQHVWNYRIRRRQRVIEVMLCPSRFIERIMRNAGLPATFLPNPVAVARTPTAQKPAGKLRLAFAGRVEPEKGLAELLESLPLDFDGSLTIIGDGSEVQRCRRICDLRKIGDRVIFQGRLKHDETVAVIAASHVLVLPSLWWENCPMSLLEALACRTNILVSDLGGMKEIVSTSGVGFVFSPGDPDSLAAAMNRIEQDHRTGTLNQFDASEFMRERNETNHLRQLLDVYRRESMHAPLTAAVGAAT